MSTSILPGERPDRLEEAPCSACSLPAKTWRA